MLYTQCSANVDVCVFHVSVSTHVNHFDFSIFEYLEIAVAIRLDYQRMWNYNFNYRDKNEGLLKVNVSYMPLVFMFSILLLNLTGSPNKNFRD